MALGFTEKQKNVLRRARDTYGARNQLAVSAEECNELAIAVLKFMRYEDTEKGIEATRVNVLEERADVEIILNHIDAIYGLTKKEILNEAQKKIARVERWLDTTDKIEYTMVERSLIEETDCTDCFYFSHFDEACEKCKDCVDNKIKSEG